MSNLLCLFLEILCPDLMAPKNGKVAVNGTTPEDTAIHSCDMGFVLEGAETLTCGDDGVWSAGPPVCRRELFHIFVLLMRNTFLINILLMLYLAVVQ